MVKYIKYLGSILKLAGVVFLVCCTKDTAEVTGPDDGTMITFSIKVPGDIAPSSRALTTPDESAVETMDILLFDVPANGGGFLYHTTADNVTIDANREGTFSVQLPIGTFDMVLIANARAEVAREVAAFTPISTKTDLQKAHIADQSGKWPAGSPNHRPLPMWAEHNGAVIALGTTISGVNLMRAVAKINVEVTAPNFKLTEVHLYNPLGQGYIIPDPNNISAQKAHSPTLDPAWVRSSGSFGYTTSANEVTATACKNEIYTFEAPAGDGTATNGSGMTDGNTFLVIGGEYDGDGYTTYYRVDIAAEQPDGTMKYLSLLRNHRYEVMIDGVAWRGAANPADAVAQGPANIAEIVVRNEADMHYYVFDDQYFVGADDREFRVSHRAASFSFKVRTDYPTGWTARASDDPINPNAGMADNWLNIVPPASGAMGTGTLAFSFTENTDTENDRIAYIHIMAGDRLDAIVKITQALKFDIGNPIPITHGYVGAFWKKDQTGERLIRILRRTNGNAIDGDWTATVVEGDDWIVLSNDPSADSGVTWTAAGNPANMLTASNDTQYSVEGNLTKVTGTCAANTTGEIFFRIGLKDKWSDNPLYDKTDNPARYGIVLLEYNNDTKRHLIFVRQGEDPDYLMRPGDPTKNNTLTSNSSGIYRNNARKWSTYNLTAAEFNNGGTMQYVQLAVRGGVFALYPSQPGAHFQWANPSRMRYAYNPMITSITGWNTTAASENWNASTHEICPTNYRHFTDNQAGTINSSEVRQSLWLNPQSGANKRNLDNILSGYYADGWFDRRVMNAANNAVATGTTGVAYRGDLFYNPYTYNSLFMPASGSRGFNGVQTNVGIHGIYWSSTQYTTTMPWAFYDGILVIGNSIEALAVRCVSN